jgi:undecaprenyl-diphosphatase
MIHQSMPDNIQSFLKARLSREGILGFHFTIGIVLLGAATWLFSELAENVSAGAPLTQTDVRFSNWLHEHMTPVLTKVMLVITNIHSTSGISVMTVLVMLLLWRTAQRRHIASFLFIVYGGILLNWWLKSIFQRSRPQFIDPLLVIKSFSFPSGHTMAATVFYGALSAILISQTRNLALRILIVCAAVFMILLVGFTRMYLGVHYLTDVVGAMIEGAGWLTLCLTSFQVVRAARHPERRAKMKT